MLSKRDCNELVIFNLIYFQCNLTRKSQRLDLLNEPLLFIIIIIWDFNYFHKNGQYKYGQNK